MAHRGAHVMCHSFESIASHDVRSIVGSWVSTAGNEQLMYSTPAHHTHTHTYGLRVCVIVRWEGMEEEDT